uniref:Uncharacterized protein n=1 Tax=Gallus gallus TaxID=9031 RepID=A0A8V0XBM9_CHICK
MAFSSSVVGCLAVEAARRTGDLCNKHLQGVHHWLSLLNSTKVAPALNKLASRRRGSDAKAVLNAGRLVLGSQPCSSTH